jgi:hypothetical protein
MIPCFSSFHRSIIKYTAKRVDPQKHTTLGFSTSVSGVLDIG